MILFIALIAASGADVVGRVRAALASDALDTAKTLCTQNRTTAQGVEACSWIARYELSKRDYPAALITARSVRSDAEALLKARKLDDEPHLPIGLGAAIEVEAQARAATGEQQQATAELKSALHTYAGTSIANRLQKNLNLLTLTGKAAPLLDLKDTLTKTAAKLSPKPTLLFFWAHWCPDCKKQAPILAALHEKFPSVAMIAPTQTYGFVRGEAASDEEERVHMRIVWDAGYAAQLPDVAVPVSGATFTRYGCSSVPTLVLLDAHGKVVLYHPGRMTEEELEAALRL